MLERHLHCSRNALEWKKSKVQLSESHGIWGAVTWEQRHRWHRMHALWNSGTSSPNLLEVPTMDSGHCHLELLLRALKAGHQDSMHLTVFDLLSEPLKVFVLEKVYGLPPTVCVVEFIRVYECGCTCRWHTCAGQLVLTLYLA